MLLTRVTLNDLGVYRGRNEFDFKTTQEKPVILIGGTNGAGKTTLFESVVLCLYGKDSFEEKVGEQKYQEIIGRQIHRYLGTKKAAEEASVIIEFEFSHQGKIEEFQIIRMWQNNNGRIDETLTIRKKNSSGEEFVEVEDFEKEEDKQIFINQLIPRGIIKLFFFDGEKIHNIAEHGNEGKHISSSFDTLLGLDLVKLLGDDIGRTLIKKTAEGGKKIESQVDELIQEKKEREANIEKNQEKIIELKPKIKSLEIQSEKLEYEFNQIGGNFATRREQYKIDLVKQKAKLNEIEKEIRALCSDTLPFTLIPNELEEIKNQIKEDEKTIESNLEKSVLEKKFSEIVSDVKSEAFLKDVSSDLKNKITGELDDLLQEKLESSTRNSDLVYNLSMIDMKNIVQLIDKIKETGASEIEMKVKSLIILDNEVQRLKVGLESAPEESVTGPLFSRLRESERELAEKKNELDVLEGKIQEDKSLITNILNQKIRQALHGEQDERKNSSMHKIGKNVQVVLDKYAQSLRSSKIKALEDEILLSLQTLLHKKGFVQKVSIDKETFQVKLFKGDDDEITKDMLSKGELQMYATAIVWGLAKTSGRPLPFIIDTPLARLDEEHRSSLVDAFYPERHQTIILSTDSEINFDYYKKLEPNISKSFVIEYNSSEGKTDIKNRYFFDSNGEKIIEV
tara:strand:- start:322 stop:2361 length:2040 start_codon:yes stop_codon:yes gene_type:complete